jgi:hypothetical protein
MGVYDHPMRLRITADLHYNHSRSRKTADELIEQINTASAGSHDGVLLVGDTACLDGDWIERCLRRFTIDGPRLFVPGNHELWTAGPDSLGPLNTQLPQRIADAGWHWLTGQPFVGADGENTGRSSATSAGTTIPMPATIWAFRGGSSKPRSRPAWPRTMSNINTCSAMMCRPTG